MLQIKYYTYVFVRTDIPVEQIIVQSCHAALEAGIKFGTKSNTPNSLIVIGVKNKYQLEKAYNHITDKFKTEKFYEPSWDYGFTAFATESIQDLDRSCLKKYQLWRHK